MTKYPVPLSDVRRWHPDGALHARASDHSGAVPQRRALSDGALQ